MSRLQQKDLWAAEVLNWEQLREHEAYKQLDIEQSILLNGEEIRTTRCPVRINGNIFTNTKPAPAIGSHTSAIVKEFLDESVVNGKHFSKSDTIAGNQLLKDILIVDFSQFLSGPYATLRLADLGAI